MSKNGSNNTKTILQTVVFALIGVGLVYWQYSKLNANDKAAMFNAINSFEWIWALPILVVGFLSHYFRALRWDLQLRPINIIAKKSNLFAAVLVGYFANIFVPRLGEVAKCTVLAKYEKQPVDKLLGSVIAERAWDTICFGILTVITLIAQYQYIAPYATLLAENFIKKVQHEDGSYNVLLLTLVAVAILGLIVGCIYLVKSKKESKIGKIIEGILDGLKAILKMNKKGLYLIYTTLIWICYTLVAIFVFKAIPDTAHLPLLAGLSIITFGTFAMIVPAPGAIAYPIIVAPILTLYGLSDGIGQGYGWVGWASQNISILLFGLIAFISLPIINNKNANTP